MFVQTSVSGVQKELMHGGTGTVQTYVKNTKAVFHFRAIRLETGGCLNQENIAECLLDDTRTMGIGPFELIMGREFKLKVWEDAIKEMLIGEVSRYYCPYQMAVGYKSVSLALRSLAKKKANPGSSHDERPFHQCGYSAMLHGSGHPDLDKVDQDKASIAFEFELLAVEQPGEYKPDAWAMSDDQIFEEVPKLREQGNNLYRAGDHHGACELYREALSHLENMSLKELPGTEKRKKIDELKIPLLLNYSQCKLIFGEYTEVVTHTSTVLESDANNVKALFRRAKAHVGLWNLPEAENDFDKVIALKSSLSTSAEKELAKLKAAIKANEEDQRKKLSGKMFP